MTDTTPLWVTDEELIKLSGVPREKMRRLMQAYDANPRSGFPKKQPLYGDRRYYPAVLKFWDYINQLPPQAQKNPVESASRIKVFERAG